MLAGPHTDPLSVVIEEGVLIIEGEEGLAFALTPDAAIATADKLYECAATAIGREKVKQLNDRPAHH